MSNNDNNQIILEKEIDLIQSCINRMAQNSFMVKGWMIAVLIAIIALFPEDIDIIILYSTIIIIAIVFWYLDGFFLKIEKLYRWKYEWVIENRLNDDSYKYDLNPYKKETWILDENGCSKKEPSILSVMFTKTLVPFYFIIIILPLVFHNFNCIISLFNCIINKQ